ncbi:MAG TPA: carbamoyltransferase HypF [Mycobacteriales bacterium]|nr:carbamoyltransferase HypF [Mycobacteriales bacterium]
MTEPLMTEPLMTERRQIRVEGIVQGVGFRPFVHRLALELALAGQVANDSRGVLIDVQGAPEAIEALLRDLHDRPPRMAVVERIETTSLPCHEASGFTIAATDRAARPDTSISPDVATCEDCLAELADPADRRYRYPFVNCTNCGPRFTIVTGVPYDRPYTTMAGFAMCEDCRREYDDPADRRFHAQPVCCPACGPRLVLEPAPPEGGDVFGATAELLRAGKIVAVKGLGGYHLAAMAADETAVATLRARKHREDKPFAVMCADLAGAERLARIDDIAAAALIAPQRPIVLVPRRGGAALASQLAPGTRDVGLMLPYTPLHHLLLAAVGEPVVLTSGNVCDEPIAFRDDDARIRLAGIADAFLHHDRPIRTRTDDSVLRVSRGAAVPIRRSRGYAPAPVRLPVAARRTVLGCGAELKNTFALGRGDRAFVSHHIGDLENAETLESFTDGVAHLERLFGIRPEVLAHDLHPEYLSTKWALDQDGVDLEAVQHHHAHIASCLADNGQTAPVIGVAYDGLGYGSDATLWGGEIMRADLNGFTRLAHLRVVALPGGRAIREPWRMAVSWLDDAYDGEPPAGLAVLDRNPGWADVAALARSALAPRTSSIGRLFDAVAALCGLRDAVTYEGQAAIALEQAADPSETGCYPMPFDGESLDGRVLIRAVVDDLRRDVAVPAIAGRFHESVAVATAAICATLRDASATVALSGGVFQNELLVSRLAARLEADGFRVLTHRQVPCNDGGISLGQVAVAAARAAD